VTDREGLRARLADLEMGSASPLEVGPTIVLDADYVDTDAGDLPPGVVLSTEYDAEDAGGDPGERGRQ